MCALSILNVVQSVFDLCSLMYPYLLIYCIKKYFNKNFKLQIASSLCFDFSHNHQLKFCVTVTTPVFILLFVFGNTIYQVITFFIKTWNIKIFFSCVNLHKYFFHVHHFSVIIFILFYISFEVKSKVSQKQTYFSMNFLQN